MSTQNYQFFIPDVSTNKLFSIGEDTQHEDIYISDLPNVVAGYSIQNDANSIPDLCMAHDGPPQSITVIDENDGKHVCPPSIYLGGNPNTRP